MNLPSTDIQQMESKLSKTSLNSFKQIVMTKKRKRLNIQKYKSGRWDNKEQSLFLNLFKKYKKNWKKVLFSYIRSNLLCIRELQNKSGLILRNMSSNSSRNTQ